MDTETRKAIIDLHIAWAAANPSGADKTDYGRNQGGIPSANELISEMEQNTARGQRFLEFMEACAGVYHQSADSFVRRLLDRNLQL